MHYQSTVADDCQGGFIGQNYETACPFPTYGFGCQTVCFALDEIAIFLQAVQKLKLAIVYIFRFIHP